MLINIKLDIQHIYIYIYIWAAFFATGPGLALIFTTLEFSTHNFDFHLLTTSVNAKYYIYIYIFSKNLLVYYCKCYNMIGCGTRYLFVNRYRIAASNSTRPSFSQKKQCLFLVFWNNFEEITNTSLFFTKTIRLLNLNFYETIVNSDFALVI